MANVDFIDVTGPSSLEEFASRTSEALDSPAERGVDTDGIALQQYTIDFDAAAVAILREDTSVTERGYDGAPFYILVERIGEYPEAFHHARRVYQALAAATPWKLALGSDDEPEEIVETRPAWQPQSSSAAGSPTRSGREAPYGDLPATGRPRETPTPRANIRERCHRGTGPDRSPTADRHVRR
jgi:hypothetical protein